MSSFHFFDFITCHVMPCHLITPFFLFHLHLISHICHHTSSVSIPLTTSLFLTLTNTHIHAHTHTHTHTHTHIPITLTHTHIHQLYSEFVERFKGLRPTSWIRNMGATRADAVCKLLLEDVMKRLSDDEKAQLKSLAGSKVSG